MDLGCTHLHMIDEAGLFHSVAASGGKDFKELHGRIDYASRLAF
jgi:hypothetical protein